MEDNCKMDYDKAWKLAQAWKWSAIGWRVLEHFFVVGAFAASVGVIYLSTTGNNCDEIVVGLSALSATLTLTGFACHPSVDMKNYRMAFELLNAALISQTEAKGKFKNTEEAWKVITDAIVLGEKYIGKTCDTPDFEKDKVCDKCKNQKRVFEVIIRKENDINK